MSSVYVAFDTTLNARVAVKEMKGSFMSEAEWNASVEQFRREAQMVANLDHRNLPRVSNFFIEEKSCFLVMDLIDGQSLERLLNQNAAPLPQELVLPWAYEVCQVLEYLHGLNPPVIFRDLKPSNIMVARDGHIKLIDFGISKTFEADGGTRTIIKGAGTPGFAPPEQYATQQQRTDPRSDVYALGATLYTLLAYKVPIEATQRMMDQVIVLQVGEGISPVLDALIAQMLSLQPADRPQSVKEVREALLSILGAPPPMDPITLPPALQWAPVDPKPLDDATILPPNLRPAKPPSAPLAVPNATVVPVEVPAGGPTAVKPAPRNYLWPVTGAAAVVAVLGGWFFGRPTPPAPTPSPSPSIVAVAAPTPTVTPSPVATPSPTPTPVATPTPPAHPTIPGDVSARLDRARDTLGRARVALNESIIRQTRVQERVVAIGQIDHALSEIELARHAWQPGADPVEKPLQPHLRPNQRHQTPRLHEALHGCEEANDIIAATRGSFHHHLKNAGRSINEAAKIIASFI